jgi:hypothetical protein
MYVCMYVNILTVCDIRIHCRANLAVVFRSSCFNGQRADLAVVFPMHSSSAGGTIRVRSGHSQGPGTNFPCSTCFFQAGASGRDATCSE